MNPRSIALFVTLESHECVLYHADTAFVPHAQTEVDHEIGVIHVVVL